jgi:hypothetical protein
MLQFNEAERIGGNPKDDRARCDACRQLTDDPKDASDATLCPGCYRDRMVADVVAGVRCVCCWELKANCGYARVSAQNDNRPELPAGAELEPSVRYAGGGVGRFGDGCSATDYGRGED